MNNEVKSICFRLFYNDTLKLEYNRGFNRILINGSFYKMRLKRYVHDVRENQVVFKKSLTYIDFKKVIKLCKKQSEKKEYSFCVDSSVIDYINSKEVYINTRSKMGIEIKQRNEKYYSAFNEFSNVVNQSMVRQLRDKQMWDAFFMLSMQKSGNFSVPGSGKTSSVLGVYAYLKNKAIVKRVVVICPKNAFGSWIDEFNLCFGNKEKLEVFNMHSSVYQTKKDVKRALNFDSGKCNLFLINYESVSSVITEIKEIVSKQTLLVFDEVHRIKKVNGLWASFSLEASKDVSHVIAMTGTPVPNSYVDIYNFLHLLFPYEYDEFFNFLVNELKSPSIKEIGDINNKIQPFFCRTTKKQLSVPDANSDIIFNEVASDNENRLFDVLKMKYRGNKLALIIRILQLESNPNLLLDTLDLHDFSGILNLSTDVDKIDYVDYSSEVKKLISSINGTTKFNKCLSLVKNLTEQNKTVVIWCIFKNSIERLSRELGEKGIECKAIYGEVDLNDRLDILNDFKIGKFDVLITNPHTLAESVSLHNVCHDAVYFEYSYNLVHLLQSKDRIHRLGLAEDQYTQYYYMQMTFSSYDGLYSLDERIYERLYAKEQTMLNAIERNELETLPTTEEEIELIFKDLF